MRKLLLVLALILSITALTTPVLAEIDHPPPHIGVPFDFVQQD